MTQQPTSVRIEPIRDGELPEALLRLVRDRGRRSAPSVWRALDPLERERALEAAVDEGPDARRKIQDAIARRKNFRLKTVLGWHRKKLVENAKTTPLSPPVLSMLLVQLHNRDRRDLMKRFWDTLGVPNEDGAPSKPEKTHNGDRDYTSEEIYAALESVRLNHGVRETVVFVLALRIAMNPSFRRHLEAWFKRLLPGPDSTSGSSKGGVDLPEDDDDSEEPEEQVLDDGGVMEPGLTTLDRLLIDALDASADEIHGGFTEDQMEDAIQELIHLNGKRATSYFHRGLQSVVFENAPQYSGQRNEEQEAWYWAGRIRGWARKGDWSTIASAYDESSVVRALGRGPGHADTVERVIDALGSTDRSDEVSGFVGPKAFTVPGGLFSKVLKVGTELLHDEKSPGTARGVFEVLAQAAKRLEGEGYVGAERNFFDARRRLAHCLQQMDDHTRAQQILEELLTDEANPNRRAMIAADLGLVKAGFRSLGDVALPNDASRLPGFVTRLTDGREWFEKSIEHNVRYSGHGHYCLSVLELAKWAQDVVEPKRDGNQEDTEKTLREVTNRLQKVQRHLADRRKSYGKMLDRVDIYMALALAGELVEMGKLSTACRVVAIRLKEGMELPIYLLPFFLSQLGVAEIVEGRDVVANLAASGNNRTLDVIAKHHWALKTSPRVRQVLVDRAKNRTPNEEDAGTLYQCYHVFLDSGNETRAREVMDLLEGYAHAGCGVDRFEDLLLDPAEGYRQIWEEEEAQEALARVLYIGGREADAAGIWEELGHSYFRKGNLHRARSMVEVLEESEEYSGQAQTLRMRLEKKEAKMEVAPELEGERPRGPTPICRVLFVGGDELQKQDAVLDELREEAPHVSVDFIASGWTPGWRKYAEEVKRRLRNTDTVVMSEFIRTEFGRKVRRLLGDTPWWSCGSRGTGATVNAIKRAAAMHARRRRTA